jgi:hypothetical protein
MRFVLEERTHLSVLFRSEAGGLCSFPPATWETLGRPRDFEVVVGEVESIGEALGGEQSEPKPMEPPTDAET